MAFPLIYALVPGCGGRCCISGHIEQRRCLWPRCPKGADESSHIPAQAGMGERHVSLLADEGKYKHMLIL
jgi:hypothetical protein